VTRQYDTSVRTSTVVGPGAADAAVVRLRGTDRALGLKVDGNGRYAYLDPRVGGRIAVAEAARNVACVGARPMAITNCLNFGNPRRPEVYYQLRETIAGMGEACRALGTPVTGGNVSLYNESPSGAIYPTPIIGMVGLIDSVDRIPRSAFRSDAEAAIVLLGEPTDEIGGSEYLARVHGVVAGAPPACDPAAERALIDALLAAIGEGVIGSAHDISEGGFAVSLAECCIGDPERLVGAAVDLSAWPAVPLRALLFGEGQGRVIVSTSDAPLVVDLARRQGVPAREIGRVRPGADDLRIISAGGRLAMKLKRLADLYYGAIPRAMAVSAAAEPVAEESSAAAFV
jgi:phosphoribosylformylglycinamidine synthase